MTDDFYPLLTEEQRGILRGKIVASQTFLRELRELRDRLRFIDQRTLGPLRDYMVLLEGVYERFIAAEIAFVKLLDDDDKRRGK